MDTLVSKRKHLKKTKGGDSMLTQIISLDDQEWIRNYEEQDHWGRSFEAFEWTYEPNFDLGLMGNAKEWANWMEQESECFVQDHGYSRYGEIASWWLKTPEQEPLIVVEIPDEEKELRDYTFITWDGAHRVGLSCLNHHPTAPAFVGKIKKK